MNLSDLVHRTTKGNESIDSAVHKDHSPPAETIVTQSFYNVHSAMASSPTHYPMEGYYTPLYHSSKMDGRDDTNPNSRLLLDDAHWYASQPTPRQDQKTNITSSSFHPISSRQSPSSPNLAPSATLLPIHTTIAPSASFPIDSGNATGLPSPRTHQTSPSPRKSVSPSPESYGSHEQTHHVAIAPSTQAAFSTVMMNEAPAVGKAGNSPANRFPPTITGDNVTSANIEDGYIQYVLYTFPDMFSDSIDSHMFAKRQFSNVPRTGDISYTTWDIYTLVKKLISEELKNWSQLVVELGFEDKDGKPQFARRVKKWMKKRRIDCYFDYLLGLQSTEENKSVCLEIRNYRKREPTKTRDKKSSKKRRTSQSNGEESANSDDDDDEDSTAPSSNHHPIAMAGSRKRMRDPSRAGFGLPLAENAEGTFNAHDSMISENEKMDDESDDENNDEEEEEEDANILHNQPLMGASESTDSEEEDELASTSSSAGSPIMKHADRIPSEPKRAAKTDNSKHTSTDAAGPSNGAYGPVCLRCEDHEKTIKSLQDELKQLKEQVTTLEKRQKDHEKDTSQIFRQMAQNRKSAEQWRKSVAELVMRGPIEDYADGSK